MINIENEIHSFLEEWQQYAKNLHTFCDTYELLQIDSPDKFLNIFKLVEEKSGISSEQMLSSAYNLRRKLFILNENELSVGTVYQWNSFKKQFPIVEEIKFLTPFSFTLYWRSIPELMSLYKISGLREATFVCDDFIENLVFKYPKTLEKFAFY